jgi:hypothetical protein
LAWGPAAPDAGEAPVVDVYTMGAGDLIFEHFGHAAICVTDQRAPNGRCYNYGTADFSTPIPLTWDFIRGRAKFWVSVTNRERMLAYYLRSDRSVWRQRLALAPEQAHALAEALEASTGESAKYYRYHHFLDNCTTRIRDHVDRVVAGALSQATAHVADGPSFREYAERGFAGDAPLLVAANVILGRAADHPTTDWEGMFLPEIFRRELEENLGAKPELVHQRKKIDEPQPTWLGEGLLATIGVVLTALIFGAWRTGPRAFRASLAVTSLVLGLFGAVLWSLAILSAFEELRNNEVLLVLFPLDVALAALPARLRLGYARARLAGLALVIVLSLLGAFVQPLAAAVALAAPPLALIARR